MSPLLGPILAQLVTLGVADRTEVRQVQLDTDNRRAEAATLPRAGLNFAWKHTSLSLAYGPSITLSPLAKDPNVLVFHMGSVALSHSWSHTSLTVGQSVGYGEVNFRSQSLADPGSAPIINPPGTGTPPPTTGGATPPITGGATPPIAGTPGTGTPPVPGTGNPQFLITDQIIRFQTFVSSLGIAQTVSPVLTLRGDFAYIVSGAIGADQISSGYSLVRGPRAVVSATYRATRLDTLISLLSAQQGSAANGNNAWIWQGNEVWTHAFNKRTTTVLGTGLSATRNSQADGLIYYNIYPNFLASINHALRLGNGTLTLGATTGSQPYIDPVQGSVDPRLVFGVFAGWIKDRFSTTLAANSAVSLNTYDNNGTLHSLSGSLGAAYRLSDNFGIDCGVRSFWQSFEGLTTVPRSYSAYAGVTFGAQAPLNH